MRAIGSFNYWMKRVQRQRPPPLIFGILLTSKLIIPNSLGTSYPPLFPFLYLYEKGWLTSLHPPISEETKSTTSSSGSSESLPISVRRPKHHWQSVLPTSLTSDRTHQKNDQRFTRSSYFFRWIIQRRRRLHRLLNRLKFDRVVNVVYLVVSFISGQMKRM